MTDSSRTRKKGAAGQVQMRGVTRLLRDSWVCQALRAPGLVGAPLIEAHRPDFEEKDITVNVDNGALVIQAERHE